MEEPIPNRVALPIRQVPPMTDRGAAWTPSSRTQSCSTMAPVLMMQSSPISARALIMAPRHHHGAGPDLGCRGDHGRRVDEGRVGQPRDLNLDPSFRRSPLMPIATVPASICPSLRTSSRRSSPPYHDAQHVRLGARIEGDHCSPACSTGDLDDDGGMPPAPITRRWRRPSPSAGTAERVGEGLADPADHLVRHGGIGGKAQAPRRDVFGDRETALAAAIGSLADIHRHLVAAV